MTRIAISAAVAVALGLSAGCAPFPSRTDTATVREELADDAFVDRFRFEDASALAWNSFDDPLLEALIAEALRDNLRLQSQKLSVDSTRIGLEAVRVRLFPMFTLTGPNAAVSRAKELSTQEVYSFSGSASYEIDLWHEVRNDVEQQMLAVINSEDVLKTSRISIAAQVTRLYFLIRFQDESLRLEQEQLRILGEQRRLTEVNFRTGSTTRQQLDRLDVEIERRRSNIESDRIARRSTLQALAAVLGKPVQQFSLPPTPFVETRIPRLDPAVPAELLRNRPDIRIAERQIRAADLSLENARSAWLPALSATAGTSSSSGSLGDLLAGDSITSNIGLRLSTLLFDNGNRDRNVRRSEISMEQAILDYEGSVLVALSDIENALNDQYENVLQIEILQRQADAQARVTERIQILYQTGQVSAFDLITEQRNLLGVQRQRVANWRNGMIASVSILQALGIDPLESITP